MTEEKLANHGGLLHAGISRIYIFLSNDLQTIVTEPSTVGHIISERHWKSTFDFTKSVNSYGLKRGIVCRIVRSISQFSLILYKQFWKYFHSMILGSLGRGYKKKY